MHTTMKMSTSNFYNEKALSSVFNENAVHESHLSTRQGTDPGYNMLLSESNKKPGFNVTMPRFNYLKEQLRMAEVPGPGSYARTGTQEPAKRNSPNNKGAAGGNPLGLTSTFKDSTSRDDHKSYLAHEKNKTSLAPTDYFTEQRPFLKKTFNATLPPPKFY